jgi:hypothetical protein
MRQLLSVEAGSQPHITILPPRPLTMPVEEAKQKLTSIFARWHAFYVELCGIEVFPGTNVLYLEVSEGGDMLSRLHAELNAGDFAHEELFQFHPHVTVGGPVPQEELGAIRRNAVDVWESHLRPCRFKIQEIAFVSIAAHGARGDWRRLWVHKLRNAKAYKQFAGAATTQTF